MQKIGSQGDRDQEAEKDKVEVDTIMDSRNKAVVRLVWLIET